MRLAIIAYSQPALPESLLAIITAPRRRENPFRSCRRGRMLPAEAFDTTGREDPMNGAEVIAQILKIEGTEFYSCYPRNLVIELCAAIDIRPILCRQERVGVGIADGYSRIKR